MNIILFVGGGGVHNFFHQGNKLVSNQKVFVFSVREPSNNYFVISRHHFSSLAYIYMQIFFNLIFFGVYLQQLILYFIYLHNKLYLNLYRYSLICILVIFIGGVWG